MGSAECALTTVNGYRLSVKVKKVVALVMIIGALPFLINASAHAEESRWLDDYHAKVGLTYNAQALVQTSYLWRGLYCGAANIQASANVGYGGLYFDMWWNIGVTDWTFKVFEPEVDLSLGFSRWGLDVFLLYIHNFNCPFFDFHNYADRGNRLELDVRYTVSSKLPLSILWATRIGASDAVLNENGEWVQAYSSYLELSYTQKLRDGFSLYGAIGMTPWKSVYNPNGAALQNIELRLRKDWSVAEHCGVMLQAQMAVNPMQPTNVINLNAAFGVYLK